MIVYVTVGNSDNKLTQQEYADLLIAVNRTLEVAVTNGGQWIGRWFSAPDVPWQNACWCLDFDDGDLTWTIDGRTFGTWLRNTLQALATKFRQDAIVWAPAVPEMLGPAVSS